MINFFPKLVQEVGSESVDVVLAIWRQTGGLFLRNHMLFLDELVFRFSRQFVTVSK